MKRITLFLILSLGQIASAETKLSALPLLSAGSVGSTDSFPFVNVSGSKTARIKISDLVNVPLLQMVGDSGAGGTIGFCPAPGAGTAAANKFLKADGTWANPAGSTAPTVSVLTTTSHTGGFNGSGSYTRPSNPTPLYIRVRMVGGGGGGGGAASAGGTNAGGAGGAGGNTTFGTSLLVANGGSGATAALVTSGGQGGAGGTASLGTGPSGVAISGGSGTGSGISNNTNTDMAGGAGGASPFGGAGGGSAVGNNGNAAQANTGSGGGGAGGQSAQASGAGGGSGGYVDAIITSPASSYSSVAVGSGGTAGSGGWTGGAGGSGIIIVEEFYQ